MLRWARLPGDNFLSPVAALGITMRRQYGTMYARLDFCHSLRFILLTHTRINYETKLNCHLFHTMRGQTCGLAGAQILGAQSGLISRRNLQPAFRLSVIRTLITAKLVCGSTFSKRNTILAASKAKRRHQLRLWAPQRVCQFRNFNCLADSCGLWKDNLGQA